MLSPRLRPRVLTAAGLTLALGAGLVAADDEPAPGPGRLGLTLELSQNDQVGVMACLKPALCLHPTLSYTWVKSDNVPTLSELTTTYPVYETTERYFGGGLDLVWRLRRPGPLLPYVSIGFATTRSDVPYPDLEGLSVVLRNGALHRFSGGAAVGFEYAVHRRFALYGEAGINVVRSERFGFGGRRLKTIAWGTVSSGVAAVFYLK